MLDGDWMRERLALASRLYGRAPERVLGTVWWYSTSAVLLGQPMRTLLAGTPADPALEAVTLRILPDGRLLDAYSARTFDGDLTAFGERLRTALTAAVDAVSAACGAGSPALWAIATDSLANQLLLAGRAAEHVERAVRLSGQQRAVRLAGELATAVGPQLPRPRFAQVGAHLVVRRASCCLIDRIPGGGTCASCPNQHPEVRERRIRELLE